MKKDAEFEFTPRLGRIRSRGSLKRAKGFLSKVSRAASRAGPKRGRGGARQSRQAGYGRRVVVKARIVKMTASTAQALAQHLRYISRESAMSDQDKGKLFGQFEDDIERADFLARAETDRHHFRFIVSPEDGAELGDMKPFVRGLMARMEDDLETHLDWAAAIHHNTAHPHAHIVVRGRRDDGRDLVMPRAYISHGVRELAGDLITQELGLETQLERSQKMGRDVSAERFTQTDRALLRIADDNRMLDAARGPPNYRQLNVSRLRVLSKMGLVENLRGSVWQLSSGMEQTLQRMGQRSDVTHALSKVHPGREDRRLDPDFHIEPGSQPVIGVVAAVQSGGDFHDKRFAVLDTLDGRLVRAELAAGSEIERGMVVSLLPPRAGPRKADLTIAEIAAANGGRYSPALHQAADPRTSPQFVTAHVRRLEVVRRAGLARRFSDGSWKLPGDYLERVTEWEEARQRRGPVSARVESYFSIEDQVSDKGLTWLDAYEGDGGSVSGLGAELSEAKVRRRAVLLERGMGDGRRGLLAREKEELRRVGLADVSERMARETGKRFVPVTASGKVEGTYSGTVDTGQGRLAVVEQQKSFALVPWRRALERARGKAISGVVKGQSLDWALGKGRTRGRGR